MSTKTYLFCRKNTYYYRIKVPTDLLSIIPAVEIKKSLKTSDLDKAQSLSAAMGYKVHAAFMQLRSGMLSEQQVKVVVNQLLSKKLDSDSITLSSAIKDYIRRNERSWTLKTRMEVEGSYNLLLQIMGDRPMSILARHDLVSLRDTLTKLPPNIQKTYPGRSISEILRHSNLVPMSVTSINKHLTRMSSLMRFCVLEGHISVNYAEGLQLPQTQRTDEERKSYNMEDIAVIRNLLPCDSGNLERQWIPVIGMYSGMRLDEICQLYLEDIVDIEGIPCFDINDKGDKKLKNKTSRRIIPVHPRLLKDGLLEYVENMRKGGQVRLWPNLIKRRDGYSHDFGKWYQRFNRKYVTDDTRKVFHSFRHTVADHMKQKGVSDTVIAEILGHAHDSIAMGRYGKRYQPQVLLDALLKLEYGV
ncbi:site-specific integrase [Geomobilimonas luticola]|uniref:Site-specific integrase n=1 Tax=Geomobilimonas luticola TaxID=1114878 RepID=A0ABS5SE70_9BACT|nr:site-specific integrase [Geomobilimonas luticola]MBT0652906.1 site-specific integrase [Geomobilimonas luticola]